MILTGNRAVLQCIRVIIIDTGAEGQTSVVGFVAPA
jgi:hypothetical protein